MAALSGAAIGATTGGIVGGLIGLGIPEIEAKRYEDKLRKGNYLVSVHTDSGDQTNRAKDIFKTEGAEDISTVSEATAPTSSRLFQTSLKTPRESAGSFV
jgi:gas vesicle protein